MAPRESCILAQPRRPLFHLHCCSLGTFLTDALHLWVSDHLSHCLNSSHLSDLATSVLALVQLPSSSNFCLWQLSKVPFFRWLKWYIFSMNHLIGAKRPCLHTLIVSAAGLSSLAHLKLCTLRALKLKETVLLLMDSAFPSRANSSGWPTAAFLWSSSSPSSLVFRHMSPVWLVHVWDIVNISCQAWKGGQGGNELQGYRSRNWEDRLITSVD